MPTGWTLKKLTKSELVKLHLETILKFEENKNFKYLHNFKDENIQKFFKSYIFKIKKMLESYDSN